MAAEGKSKILVIGGTGFIGKFIVEASAKAGNPTFLLIRKSTAETTDPDKAKLLQGFKDAGVTFLYVRFSRTSFRVSVPCFSLCLR